MCSTGRCGGRRPSSDTYGAASASAPLAPAGCFANRVLATAYSDTASAQARSQLAQLNAPLRLQQAFVRHQELLVEPRNPNANRFIVPLDKRRRSVPNAHGRPLRPCCRH